MNKKANIFTSIFYILLILTLIYFLIRFGLMEKIFEMVKGWFVR